MSVERRGPLRNRLITAIARAVLWPWRAAFVAAWSILPLVVVAFQFHVDVFLDVAIWLGYVLAAWGVCAATAGLALISYEEDMPNGKNHSGKQH